MGSSSYITNLDGEVVQHIEYVPFGEVFIEERNSIWNTPYLFNAKEFDEETGLYYYGARYYDPRLSVWLSVDPLAEKDIATSAYAFCGNNPIIRIDSDGKIWETVWDIGNVLYDVGAAIYNHAAGNHEAAKSNWIDAGVDAAAVVIPFVPAGATKIGKVGAAGVKAIDKTTDIPIKVDKGVTEVLTKYSKPYAKSRPSYGKGQVEEVWNSAKQPNGKVYDRFSGEELHWNPNEPRMWDMGHKPGKEYKKLHQDYMDGKISKEDFLKEYRNPKNYEPQSRTTNRSHKYEK